MLNSIITQRYVIENITLVTLAGIPAETKKIAKVFRAISDSGINVDMICQTPPYKNYNSVSFTIMDDDLSKALAIVGGFQKALPGLRTDVNSGNCKLLLHGDKMVETPGVGAWAFETLAQNDIGIKLITTSDVDISILIDAKDEDAVFELFQLNEKE